MVNQCETEATFEFENQIIVFVLLLKFEMMFFTSNGMMRTYPINLNVSNCHKWLY